MDISKIDPSVLECLRKRRWSEADIAAMTPEQAFSEFCEWNGLVGYGAKLVGALDNLRDAAGESYSIEGTVRFMREVGPVDQPDTGHIFARGVDWDEWETNHPDHFGEGPEVFVAAKVTDHDRNEGTRVRLTVEVLPDANN